MARVTIIPDRTGVRDISFSDLHAVVQAWQPIHRVWSMTFAQSGSVEDGVAVAVGIRGESRKPNL